MDLLKFYGNYGKELRNHLNFLGKYCLSGLLFYKELDHTNLSMIFH